MCSCAGLAELPVRLGHLADHTTGGTMTTSPTSGAPDYSLGVDDTERQRLLAQCARHRPEAEHLIDRIGVGPGWRTVDVG